MGSYDDQLWSLGSDRNTANTLGKPRAVNASVAVPVNKLFTPVFEDFPKVKKRSKVHVYGSDNKDVGRKVKRIPLAALDNNSDTRGTKKRSQSPKKVDLMDLERLSSPVASQKRSQEKHTYASQNEILQGSVPPGNVISNTVDDDPDTSYQQPQLSVERNLGIPISSLLGEETSQQKAKDNEESHIHEDDDVILVGSGARSSPSPAPTDEAIADSEEELELLKSSQKDLYHAVEPNDTLSQLSNCNFHAEDLSAGLGNSSQYGEAAIVDHACSGNTDTYNAYEELGSHYVDDNNTAASSQAVPQMLVTLKVKPIRVSSEKVLAETRNFQLETAEVEEDNPAKISGKSTGKNSVSPVVSENSIEPKVPESLTASELSKLTAANSQQPEQENKPEAKTVAPVATTTGTRVANIKKKISLADICGKTNRSRHQHRVGLSKRVKIDPLHGYLAK